MSTQEPLQDQENREEAVRSFLLADALASGLAKDLVVVDRLPELIEKIIDQKLWECVYVNKSVITPYYCRFIKGTDAENFSAFITAKRPNGLGTNIETIKRLLQREPEICEKFETTINGTVPIYRQIPDDNPQKAAEILLQFYQGDALAELIALLILGSPGEL